MAQTQTKGGASSLPPLNPVILTLRYHGWLIRQYRDGYWDAIRGTFEITPGFTTFEHLMDYLVEAVA